MNRKILILDIVEEKYFFYKIIMLICSRIRLRWVFIINMLWRDMVLVKFIIIKMKIIYDIRNIIDKDKFFNNLVGIEIFKN